MGLLSLDHSALATGKEGDISDAIQSPQDTSSLQMDMDTQQDILEKLVPSVEVKMDDANNPLLVLKTIPEVIKGNKAFLWAFFKRT